MFGLNNKKRKNPHPNPTSLPILPNRQSSNTHYTSSTHPPLPPLLVSSIAKIRYNSIGSNSTSDTPNSTRNAVTPDEFLPSQIKSRRVTRPRRNITPSSTVGSISTRSNDSLPTSSDGTAIVKRSPGSTSSSPLRSKKRSRLEQPYVPDSASSTLTLPATAEPDLSTSVRKTRSFERPKSAERSARYDSSLGLLTRKFMQLLCVAPGGVLDLNAATDSLNVQKRRIYDITNVLEGINLVEKIGKNQLSLTSNYYINGDKSTGLANEQEAICLQQDLTELEQHEMQLDKMIEILTVLNCQFTSFDGEQEYNRDLIRPLVTKSTRGGRIGPARGGSSKNMQVDISLEGIDDDNYYQSIAKYLCVSREDIIKLPEYGTDTVVGITPPMGTILEVPDPDTDSDDKNYNIFMSAMTANLTKPKGIDVYLLQYGGVSDSRIIPDVQISSSPQQLPEPRSEYRAQHPPTNFFNEREVPPSSFQPSARKPCRSPSPTARTSRSPSPSARTLRSPSLPARPPSPSSIASKIPSSAYGSWATTARPEVIPSLPPRSSHDYTNKNKPASYLPQSIPLSYSLPASRDNVWNQSANPCSRRAKPTILPSIAGHHIMNEFPLSSSIPMRGRNRDHVPSSIAPPPISIQRPVIKQEYLHRSINASGHNLGLEHIFSSSNHENSAIVNPNAFKASSPPLSSQNSYCVYKRQNNVAFESRMDNPNRVGVLHSETISPLTPYQYNTPNSTLELLNAPLQSPCFTNTPLTSSIANPNESPTIDDTFFNTNLRTIFTFSPKESMSPLARDIRMNGNDETVLDFFRLD